MVYISLISKKTLLVNHNPKIQHSVKFLKKTTPNHPTNICMYII